jgi:hypothetical protein
MKQANYYFTRSLFTLIAFLSLSNAFAQENVDVNGHDVGSWFGNHWMWVVGGVIVLIVLMALTTGSSKSKTTTIQRDAAGHVKNVTTTERID